MRPQAWALLVLLLLIIPGQPGAFGGTGPDDPPVTCPAAVSDLPAGPPVAAWDGPRPPLVTNPDGSVTLTLAVEDPPHATMTYQDTIVASGASVGTWSRDWPTTIPTTTVGTWSDVTDENGQTTRYRIPYAILESADGGHHVLVERLVKTSGDMSNDHLRILSGLLARETIGSPYPTDLGDHRDHAPVFVWTTLQRAPTGTLWSGFYLTQEADHVENDDGTHWHREACRRIQAGPSVRLDAETTAGPSIYLEERLWADEPQAGAADGNDTDQTRRHQFTAGATAEGIDAPIILVGARQHANGTYGTPATAQETDWWLGVHADGEDHPLLGIRSTIQTAAPPEAYNQMLSAGVYDRQGGYHPVFGNRLHFERYDALAWPLVWLGSGGPGSRDAGDWESDLGAFDPWGAFIPLAGTTYDDTLDEAGRATPTGSSGRDTYQMLVTAGAWAADTYQPAVGVTYDGTSPLVHWADDHLSGRNTTGRWLTSVGTFAPAVGHIPLAGAEHTPLDDPEWPWAEAHRVGAFTGAYAGWTPLAATEWRSATTSGRWAMLASETGAAPHDARLDAGPILAGDGAMTPLVGATIQAGETEHYTVGPWLLGTYTPVGEACSNRGGTTTETGVAVHTPLGRVPLGRVDVGPQGVDVAPGEDCDA